MTDYTNEDFEKPPKTLEYAPKVCKGWKGKRSKSKSSNTYTLFPRGYSLFPTA
jgi:hypothetical protein